MESNAQLISQTGEDVRMKTIEQVILENEPIPLSELRRQIDMGFCKVNGILIINSKAAVRWGDVITLGQTKSFVAKQEGVNQ
jgi:hypothetical protein